MILFKMNQRFLLILMLWTIINVTGKEPYKDPEGLHSFSGDVWKYHSKAVIKLLGLSMGSFIRTSLMVRLSKVVGDLDDLLTQSRYVSELNQGK